MKKIENKVIEKIIQLQEESKGTDDWYKYEMECELKEKNGWFFVGNYSLDTCRDIYYLKKLKYGYYIYVNEQRFKLSDYLLNKLSEKGIIIEKGTLVLQKDIGLSEETLNKLILHYVQFLSADIDKYIQSYMDKSAKSIIEENTMTYQNKVYVYKVLYGKLEEKYHCKFDSDKIIRFYNELDEYQNTMR